MSKSPSVLNYHSFQGKHFLVMGVILFIVGRAVAARFGLLEYLVAITCIVLHAFAFLSLEN